MKIVIEIDEARFKDIQRIAEVQLERNHFQTAEQIIARGTPLPNDKIIVVQIDCLMGRKEIEYMRKDLIEQMADGIVVVPGDAHVEYVGEASDVVIVDKNNIDDLIRKDGASE